MGSLWSPAESESKVGGCFWFLWKKTRPPPACAEDGLGWFLFYWLVSGEAVTGAERVDDGYRQHHFARHRETGFERGSELPLLDGGRDGGHEFLAGFGRTRRDERRLARRINDELEGNLLPGVFRIDARCYHRDRARNIRAATVCIDIGLFRRAREKGERRKEKTEAED